MKSQTKTTSRTPHASLEMMASMQKELKEKDLLIERLEYRLALALRHRYACRSEKLNPNHRQLNIFDEAEDFIQEENQEESESVDNTLDVQAHKRKKTGRKALPKNLPRLRREHDLSDAEKICPCGSELSAIGEETSEQLEIIPALMYVICHVKKKYACKTCSETVKQAKAPTQAIPKSMAGPGLLAHLLISKFCDHLPLYRQENILKRCGIEISRATLCHWVIRCGELVSPLVQLLQDDINAYDIAFADETRCQVLKEPGRKATQQSYMWLFGGGAPEKFAWVYQYHPSRHGIIPQTFFEDFSGSVHTDGYAGYHELQHQSIKLAGCFAHARRKFFDVAQSAKKKKGLAHWMLAKIKVLYAIERQAKEKQLDAGAIQQLRLKESKPVLDEIKMWLDNHACKVPPKSPIGKAIAYMQNQWSKLIHYLDDGRLEIDNNRTERSIKPFVIGRKNWLFSDSVKGAHAAANIFSLIETCKANSIEPYAYLRYLFVHLPTADTLDKLEALLPYNCHLDALFLNIANDRKNLAKLVNG